MNITDAGIREQGWPLLDKRLTAEIDEAPPPLPGGMGKFRSGQTDVSSRRKEILKNAVREGRWG